MGFCPIVWCARGRAQNVTVAMAISLARCPYGKEVVCQWAIYLPPITYICIASTL